jgi:hypothetical protein
VCPALSQGTKIQNLRDDNKTLKEMIDILFDYQRNELSTNERR